MKSFPYIWNIIFGMYYKTPNWQHCCCVWLNVVEFQVLSIITFLYPFQTNLSAFFLCYSVSSSLQSLDEFFYSESPNLLLLTFETGAAVGGGVVVGVALWFDFGVFKSTCLAVCGGDSSSRPEAKMTGTRGIQEYVYMMKLLNQHHSLHCALWKKILLPARPRQSLPLYLDF